MQAELKLSIANLAGQKEIEFLKASSNVNMNYNYHTNGGAVNNTYNHHQNETFNTNHIYGNNLNNFCANDSVNYVNKSGTIVADSEYSGDFSVLTAL